MIAVIVDSIGTLAANAVLGVAANASLLLGSYWIARHGFKQPRGLGVGLATALVFWTASTIGLELLGTCAAISLGPMLAWGMVIGVIGGCCRLVRAKAPDEPTLAAAGEPLSWDAILCLSLLLSAAVALGMHSLILGVKVVSDGPIYHLYFAARWWKAGRLFLVASPFGENAATYFPANGDLWFTWLMASWGGDRLAKVGQAPFFVLAAAAAYGCARRLGAGRSASLVATWWFASSTPVLVFSFEAQCGHDLRGRLPHCCLFLSRDCTRRWWYRGVLAGGVGHGGGAGDQGRRGRLCSSTACCRAVRPTLVQPVPARTRVATNTRDHAGAR